MSSKKQTTDFDPLWLEKFKFKPGRYSMLPQYHPERTYFESRPVSDLEIMLLPHQIENLENRVNALKSLIAGHDQRPLKPIPPLPKNASNADKEARDSLIQLHGKRLSDRMDLRRLEPLLEAYKLRFTERDS